MVIRYLSEHQRHIESVTFIPDPLCFPQQISFDLLLLPILRRLYWIGATGYEEMKVLGKLLLSHANHLEELGLDSPDWDNTEQFFTPPGNNFARYCLEVPLDEAKIVFPALKIASLSAVSFLRAKVELAQALNIGQLRTLKLRDCRGTNDLLADSPEALQLTSFELTKSGRYLDDWELMPLVRILKSFQSLEQLSLLCDGRRDPLIEDYWRSILHHRSTLKQFVHHQRKVKL
ncbi:hypothetical protein BKA65DRAFT_167871 [Rhexocercosporidium sp. MPI-PUGE-AT-0058]|nr:hypothetical protein BKA65DRAFT_167871 [Rhexocercosporidium sp. MPI-PUGE-AT-0058]